MMWVLALAVQATVLNTQAPPSQEIIVHGATGCGPPFARTYIAPMGEPLRTDGFTDPMKAWFDRADANHDGKVSLAELQADSDRFFTLLDKDRSGEIDPQELSDYENVLAPEIKLYQPGQDRKPRTGGQRRAAKAAARSRADYQAPYGAGEWASLNIPEPIAAADYDLNRGISRAELAQAAANRWPLLDPERRGFLTYDSLPKSPAQMDIDACRAGEDKGRR